MIRTFITFVFFIFTQTSVFTFQKNFPLHINDYVVDQTGTLSPSEKASLISKLRTFDTQTSTQIVIVIINSLEGKTIEETSIEIAEYNKIGRKGKDNGILILVAKNDKKVRIEVGYGLEGILPDVRANDIIERDITPNFRAGKYYEGLDRAINSIMKITRGEYQPDKKKESGGSWILELLKVVGAIIFIIIVIFVKGVFWGIGEAILGGSSSRGRGRWFSGGGGGFSSGGFSGGGGSFGGGGASGSW
ncbi:MAG: TPM domain-containing protein [Ignavibacteria bacterium]